MALAHLSATGPWQLSCDCCEAPGPVAERPAEVVHEALAVGWLDLGLSLWQCPGCAEAGRLPEVRVPQGDTDPFLLREQEHHAALGLN